jgi:DNA polymerase-3 subunit delta'
VSDASWWPDHVLDRGRLESFADPVLDRVVIATEAGRFPHALLLSGPAGLGRELAAVETAVMLVCGGGSWGDGSCARRVRGGNHPDVAAVLPGGAARQIKIDQVREIVDGAASRPFEGAARVWILDGVEAGHLGPAAANAFLKVLEEPPAHCRFLLLAANPSAVLPTIRSRCQQLSLPGPAEVAGRLGLEVPAGLAGAVLAGSELAGPVEEARSAIRQALDGEISGLLCLPQLMPPEVSGFELAAAAALEEATSGDCADLSPELVQLAADLMAVERQVRSLNLTADRQLASALVRWYRDLPGSRGSASRT